MQDYDYHIQAYILQQYCAAEYSPPPLVAAQRLLCRHDRSAAPPHPGRPTDSDPQQPL